MLGVLVWCLRSSSNNSFPLASRAVLWGQRGSTEPQPMGADHLCNGLQGQDTSVVRRWLRTV